MIVAGFFLMYFFVIFLGTGLVVLSIRHHLREARRIKEEERQKTEQNAIQDRKGIL